ncbi:hypothetical protein RJ640_030923 [Escallonia rubra]|uniref:GDSL esterase/lipase n=1 Tax=Escallonia rubra TaxID=112253 RepID=A0AA88QXC6_9ASTE|nr:hypothetical protein RJ640_030923 [Escallonia rubra]
MELSKVLFRSYFFLLSLLITGNEGWQHGAHHVRPTKLFVFGDSYADTGNYKKSEANSWKFPYGITFPGKPSGRFSDGRVLTDYLAKYLGVKSPIPYRWRKFAPKCLQFGMNFATGGTGVFDTLVSEPNMTTQIDNFEKLITKDSVYTKMDLQSSLALVSLAGNDYSAYFARGGSAQGLQSFITLVVNQLSLNLKRINGLGVRKVAVTTLEPLGCLPRSTVMSSFQQCNETENKAVSFHNILVQQVVAKLNNESQDSAFFVLDLFSSFSRVLKSKGAPLGNLKFETPLKPCCMGISRSYACGSMDEKGGKMYTVCTNPESAFFWDTLHPTQAGWHSVYLALQASLEEIH